MKHQVKHAQKGSEILSTTNYDMFTYFDKNREVKESRVKRMVLAIKQLDMTKERPIIVDEKMRIIDGQHRFEACKLLKKPIHYIKSNIGGRINDAVIMLNANQTPWALTDYITNYIKRGKEDYQKIVDCMDQYKVTVSAAIAFVANRENAASKSIQNGKFEAGRIKYQVFGDIYLDFKKICNIYTHIMFIRALVRLVRSGKYNHKKDFIRFDKHRMELRGCANVEQYLQLFEKILNYHRRGDRVRLVDYSKN